MALGALDRTLTIVVTATLTSAVWIAAGGTILDRARIASGAGPPRTAASPAPAAGPAKAASGAALVIPVRGKGPADLTDTFTAARAGGARVHDAIDIMAPEGTPVIAAAPGKVEKLFLSNDGGNTVYVRSPDGRTIYYYAHLDRYADGLQQGRPLRRGDVIGYVGDTGNAVPGNYHLHFAIWIAKDTTEFWDGVEVNPYPLLQGGE